MLRGGGGATGGVPALRIGPPSLGLDLTGAVLVMHIAAVILGLVAFMVLDTTVLGANLIFAAVVVLGCAAALFLAGRPLHNA